MAARTAQFNMESDEQSAGMMSLHDNSAREDIYEEKFTNSVSDDGAHSHSDGATDVDDDIKGKHEDLHDAPQGPNSKEYTSTQDNDDNTSQCFSDDPLESLSDAGRDVDDDIKGKHEDLHDATQGPNSEDYTSTQDNDDNRSHCLTDDPVHSLSDAGTDVQQDITDNNVPIHESPQPGTSGTSYRDQHHYNSDTDSASTNSSSYVWVKKTMTKEERAEYQKRRRWEYSLFEDYREKERLRSQENREKARLNPPEHTEEWLIRDRARRAFNEHKRRERQILAGIRPRRPRGRPRGSRARRGDTDCGRGRGHAVTTDSTSTPASTSTRGHPSTRGRTSRRPRASRRVSTRTPRPTSTRRDSTNDTNIDNDYENNSQRGRPSRRGRPRRGRTSTGARTSTIGSVCTRSRSTTHPPMCTPPHITNATNEHNDNAHKNGRRNPSTRGRARRAGTSSRARSSNRESVCSRGPTSSLGRTSLPRDRRNPTNKMIVKLPSFARQREKGQPRPKPHPRGRTGTPETETVPESESSTSSSSSLSSKGSECARSKPKILVRPPLLSYRSPPKQTKRKVHTTSDSASPDLHNDTDWVPPSPITNATTKSQQRRRSTRNIIHKKVYTETSDLSPSTSPSPPPKGGTRKRGQRPSRIPHIRRGRVIGTIRWQPPRSISPPAMYGMPPKSPTRVYGLPRNCDM